MRLVGLKLTLAMSCRNGEDFHQNPVLYRHRNDDLSLRHITPCHKTRRWPCMITNARYDSTRTASRTMYRIRPFSHSDKWLCKRRPVFPKSNEAARTLDS